jgi:DNA-binding transcriptional MocR family regulator
MPHVTDPYRDRYAKRTAGMTGSEIRALFAVLQRPEIVSLAGGAPYMEAMPPERVIEITREVLERDSAIALQYGGAHGVHGLKEQLVRCMAEESIEADPHELIVTDGAQQALELLAKIFLDPGDVILVEAPTYVGALGAFASYQADIRTVTMDDDGVDPAALSAALDQLRRGGLRPKFLYLVPTFQNPSGVTLAAERRRPILDICRDNDVLVIEDNPYALVRFEGEPVTPLRALAPDQVIYLGTLSKIFSPGMRIGWVLAPEPVRDRLVLAKEAADLCSSPFTQMIAEAYLGSDHARADLDVIRKIYRDRRDAMLDAMDEHFPPEARTRVPEGGLFLWVTIPGPLDTKAMLGRALEAGVAYVPGTAFYPDGSGRDSMRLNFSFPPPERIEEGMRRLGAVLNEELELARSLEG